MSAATMPADATPTREELRLAETLKALASPVRLGLLRWLVTRPWCITGQVVEASGLAQSTVSRHLSVLRQSGLLCCEPSGTATCCCVDAAALQRVAADLEGFAATLRAAADACCGDEAPRQSPIDLRLDEPAQPRT